MEVLDLQNARNNSGLGITLPESDAAPENRPLEKGDSYWKPQFFKCYVSFQGGYREEIAQQFCKLGDLQPSHLVAGFTNHWKKGCFTRLLHP